MAQGASVKTCAWCQRAALDESVVNHCIRTGGQYHAGVIGPAIRTRLEDAQRAAACVARYLEAAKGRPRRSS